MHYSIRVILMPNYSASDLSINTPSNEPTQINVKYLTDTFASPTVNYLTPLSDLPRLVLAYANSIGKAHLIHGPLTKHFLNTLTHLTHGVCMIPGYDSRNSIGLSCSLSRTHSSQDNFARLTVPFNSFIPQCENARSSS